MINAAMMNFARRSSVVGTSTVGPAEAAPTPVRVYRAGEPGSVGAADELVRDVARVRRVARWMDARFSLFGVKVGLDGLLGLVPVVGDTLASAIGLYPLHVARKHQLPPAVQLRIAGNVLADWAVGLVPVAGDLFDVAFKANLRNADLLERAAADRLGRPVESTSALGGL
ncbi:MAG: hypothetical protein JWO31_1961 [Phycisphaerales bacterium]|nr:hypothetical protein [Phycisphaerales bacterium]